MKTSANRQLSSHLRRFSFFHFAHSSSGNNLSRRSGLPRRRVLCGVPYRDGVWVQAHSDGTLRKPVDLFIFRILIDFGVGAGDGEGGDDDVHADSDDKNIHIYTMHGHKFRIFRHIRPHAPHQKVGRTKNPAAKKFSLATALFTSVFFAESIVSVVFAAMGEEMLDK
jgi:hypothetical protein